MAIDIRQAALILVDVQNDFCPAYTGKDGKQRPEGAMAAPQGYEVIEPLNQVARRFNQAGQKVIASQDWHEANHCSFASSHPGKAVNDVVLLPVPRRLSDERDSAFDPAGGFLPSAIQQILWPDHCVRGTEGARFHDDLNLEYVDLVIRKGHRKDLDSYSVFFENDRTTATGLDGYLKGLGISHVFIGGLVTDYCILYSAIDATRLGYQATVFSDAICGVNIPEGSVERAFSLMEQADVAFVATREVLG
jgi:nicotinamidase/pyrazinamidase